MFLRVATLLSVIWVAHGSICCMPGKFEAIQYFEQATYTGGQQQLFQGEMGVALDGDIQMKNAYIGMTTESGQQISWRVIEDYGKTMARYSVSIDGSECNKTALTTNWTGACIPDGSIKEPPLYFGMSPSQLDVDLYIVPYKPMPDWQSLITVSRADCAIAMEFVQGTQKGAPFMVGVYMTNVTLGIKNPAVFDIPPSCKGKTANGESQMDDTLRWKRGSIMP